MSYVQARVPGPSPVVSRLAFAALAAVVVGSLALVAAGHNLGATAFEAAMAAIAAASVGYALWLAPPAYTLSMALVASVFSGNWTAMGLPHGIPPDHILETLGVLLVLVRAPAVADRRLRFSQVHWVMAAALVYVAINDLAANGHITATFNLLDGFGLFPFLFFLVAPVAFQTRHERNVLLATLVLLGAYLGFTAIVEALHVNALVWPKYILNSSFGDPSTANRVRGPFAAAVQMGFGLYACALACALALATWRRPGPRAAALVIGVVCLVGTILTEQRSVWLATAVATVLALLITPRLRRWTLPALGGAALIVALLLTSIPGLSSNVRARLQNSEPVWERLNLNVAAENMIEAKPIFGFGWNRFADVSQPYFRQSSSYPLVYTTVVHDVYLGFGAELGIVGLALWLLVLILGIGGVVVRPPPEAVRIWRYAALTYAAFYLIVIAFVPIPTSLPPLFMWLVAGVATGWGLPAISPRTAEAAARLEALARGYRRLARMIPAGDDPLQAMRGPWASEMLKLGEQSRREISRSAPELLPYWEDRRQLPPLTPFAHWAQAFTAQSVWQLSQIAARLRQSDDRP